ncbi:MAG: isoprenyl transferase [Candidatus Scatovivens sp.]
MISDNLPTHVAIIMDGNRRWAKNKNLPIKLGHKEGAKTLEKIIRYANKIGVKYVTVYAFSTENWKRSDEEVTNLMNLLRSYVREFSKKADTENIKIRVIGNISELDEDLQNSIKEATERTKENTGTVFCIALNYGGRDEIVNAIKAISNEVKNDRIKIDDINEKIVENYLYTKNIPDPDLLIRTSGEMRTSGFLPWQLVYSEFVFINKNWPDFNEEDFDECIEIYNKRNRKFGAN